MENSADGVPAVRIDNLTIRYGAVLAADRVSFSVPRGSIYALLGRSGSGKSSIVRCLLGRERPQGGTAFLLGEESWRHRRRLMKRVGVVMANPAGWFRRRSSQEKKDVGVRLTAALARHPELLILDDPTRSLDEASAREFSDELRDEHASRGLTALVASKDPAGLEGIADRIGILKAGRLVLDEEMNAIRNRFRKIRYSNDRGAVNAVPGTELDPFFALSVQVRGWGIEAVVSDFTDEAFAKFTRAPGVVDAEASPITVAELFRAVAGIDPALRPDAERTS